MVVIMAMSPWAKLSTRDVRYNSTIPKATRAYRLPMDSPLTTNCQKSTGRRLHRRLQRPRLPPPLDLEPAPVQSHGLQGHHQDDGPAVDDGQVLLKLRQPKLHQGQQHGAEHRSR